MRMGARRPLRLAPVDEVGNQLVAQQLKGRRIAKEGSLIGGDGVNDSSAQPAAGVGPHLVEELGEIGRPGFGKQAAQARLHQISLGLVQMNPADLLDVAGPDRHFFARNRSTHPRPPLTAAAMRLGDGIQRQHDVRHARIHRGFGHAVDHAAGLVLGDDKTTVALEQAQAERSVAAHAGENDGHGAPRETVGRRAKQVVDGRPAVVLGRIVGELDAPAGCPADSQPHLPAARAQCKPCWARETRRALLPGRAPRTWTPGYRPATW